MNKINQTASIIYEQINDCLPLDVIWSWGISQQRAILFKEMPSLALKVNGFQHKGWVIISLNEGIDLYNIYLLNNQFKVIKTIKDVYCDELDILDSLIETGEMNEQEYSERVKQDIVQPHALFETLVNIVRPPIVC